MEATAPRARRRAHTRPAPPVFVPRALLPWPVPTDLDVSTAWSRVKLAESEYRTALAWLALDVPGFGGSGNDELWRSAYWLLRDAREALIAAKTEALAWSDAKWATRRET